MSEKKKIEDIDSCSFQTMYRKDSDTGEKSVFGVICIVKFKDGTYAFPPRSDDVGNPKTELEAFRRAMDDEAIEIPDRFKEEFRVAEIEEVFKFKTKLTHHDRKNQNSYTTKLALSLREFADYVEANPSIQEKKDTHLACGSIVINVIN